MKEFALSKKNSLLEDKPFGAILKFSVPFIVGDFCQQLYNAVDSMIVGKFIGTQALASLGVATPIMSLVIFLLVGFGMGTGVVVSQYYGRGENEKIKRIASTGLLVGIIFTLILTVFSIGLSKPFLTLLRTPANLVADTDIYLKIIFAGTIFTFIYNFYCYSIRSIGNSVMPLVFLLVAVALNAALDLVFVLVFDWGVVGVAVATVISQFFSALLCVIYTQKKIAILRLGVKDCVIDKKYIKPVISYSSALALQQVYIYIGRIAVQGLVNGYGENVIAGVNVANKLDSLFETPIRGYTNALTTYNAQNFGMNNMQRIKKGYLCSWVMVIANAVFTLLIGLLLSKQLVSLFVGEGQSEVIEIGARFFSSMVWGYLFLGLIVQSQALFKGTGRLAAFFGSTLMSISCRVIFSYLFDYLWGMEGMFWAVTCSWIAGGMYGIIMSVVFVVKKFKLAPNEKTTA
ncbi:MAG: MATE family efflux transporter [Clostridia bacterium]